VEVGGLGRVADQGSLLATGLYRAHLATARLSSHALSFGKIEQLCARLFRQYPALYNGHGTFSGITCRIQDDTLRDNRDSDTTSGGLSSVGPLYAHVPHQFKMGLNLRNLLVAFMHSTPDLS
jgi:hypothetical protein